MNPCEVMIGGIVRCSLDVGHTGPHVHYADEDGNWTSLTEGAFWPIEPLAELLSECRTLRVQDRGDAKLIFGTTADDDSL
jgi:hypothetical protein